MINSYECLRDMHSKMLAVMRKRRCLTCTTASVKLSTNEDMPSTSKESTNETVHMAVNNSRAPGPNTSSPASASTVDPSPPIKDLTQTKKPKRKTHTDVPTNRSSSTFSSTTTASSNDPNPSTPSPLPFKKPKVEREDDDVIVEKVIKKKDRSPTKTKAKIEGTSKLKTFETSFRSDGNWPIYWAIVFCYSYGV